MARSRSDLAFHFRRGGGLCARTLALSHGLLKQVFDLAVDTAQLVGRPGFEFFPKAGIDPQQKGLPVAHEMSLRVERAGVDDWMHFGFAAEHYHKIADHCGPPLVVQLHDFLFRKLSQGHVHHADSAMNDLLPRGNDRFGLLPAKHGLGDFRGVRQVC